MGCAARGCSGQALCLFCYANAEWLEAFCRAALPNLTAPERRVGVRHTLGILRTGHGVICLQHHLTFHLYSSIMNTEQLWMENRFCHYLWWCLEHKCTFIEGLVNMWVHPNSMLEHHGDVCYLELSIDQSNKLFWWLSDMCVCSWSLRF